MSNLLPTVNKNPIRIHNKLAEAKYVMNVSEQKLFLYAIRNMDQSGEGFPESTFSIKSFAEYSGLEETRLYKDIEKMTTRLMQVIIHIKDDLDENKWVKHNLTKTCRYDNGYITFKFNDDMRPFLLQLQTHYFKQALSVMGFSSWYSFRIYDLLKSRIYMNKDIKIEVDWLRSILDIEEKYRDFYGLNTRVIKPSIEEINAYSDIHVSYERIKKGCKIVALNFTVKCNGTTNYAEDEVALSLPGLYNMNKFREEIGLGPKTITDMQIIKLYEISVAVFTEYRSMDDLYRYMELNYKYTRKQKPHGNPYYYYKKSLENDYAKAIPQILNDYIIKD